MIGTQLGRWIIDRELGKGAMGAVYFAHAADAPDEVRAIKVLAPDLAREELARQRFKLETDVLCLLDHPNIVRFDGAGTEGDTLYYVMEFVDGPDCESRLRELGRWPWADVLDVTIQLVNGLKYAHDQGIVHRDLKPANILLAQVPQTADHQKPHFVAKIADFGVARLFNRVPLTGSGNFIGTALYMAPEQAAGKPASKRSDFYSVGCLMYTLLTGRPPFNGTSLAELVHKHQFVQPERPSRLRVDLPHDIDELVVQLLAKDPAQRPADGSVLLKKLESIRGKLHRKHDLRDTSFRLTFPRSGGNKSNDSYQDGPHESLGSNIDYAKAIRATLLTLALAIVVGLIAWKLSRPRSTAERLMEQARPLMNSPHPEDWNRAWAEYLDPMLTRFPNHPYTLEVEAFQSKLDALRSLRRAYFRGKPSGQRSEAQRFFERGLSEIQRGEIDRGRRNWQALILAFDGVPGEEAWIQLAKRGLSDFPNLVAETEPAGLNDALVRARSLVNNNQRDQAEKIWTALEDLYRNDPVAEKIQELIRAERAKK